MPGTLLLVERMLYLPRCFQKEKKFYAINFLLAVTENQRMYRGLVCSLHLLNRKLMLRGVNQEYNTDATKCKRNKIRIVGKRILMLRRVNGSKMRIGRNTILMLQSVEVAVLESSGVGY
jgi:hypothetical protein